MRNLGLKVTALFLAGVVWLIVSAPRRELVREKILTAPVSLVPLSRNLIITSTEDLPANVTVRVRGRASELRALTPAMLDVPVDLSWITQPGEVEITLRPQGINVPENVEVLTITPNKFRVRIEQLRRRTVPIRPFLVGGPPVGYLAGDASASPDRALISGPASQVMQLSEVATERIIMTGRTETFAQNVAVVSDSSLVRVISPLTTQVTVPVLAEMGPNQPATDTTATTTTTTQEKR
jgi:YbbR domain-containing protein